MSQRAVGNFLRAHRRRCGLSQRELGTLVGYPDDEQVARHENSVTVPPLRTALAYEIVLEIPVSKLFRQFHADIAEEIGRNLVGMKAHFEAPGNGRLAKAMQRKLKWLNQRSGS
jgi:transcriptional regulator with XRE-family HTH domain